MDILTLENNLYICSDGGRDVCQQAFQLIADREAAGKFRVIWLMSFECHFGTESQSVVKDAVSDLFVSHLWVQIKPFLLVSVHLCHTLVGPTRFYSFCYPFAKPLDFFFF